MLKPAWTIYGRRRLRSLPGRQSFVALHQDKFESEADAVLWLMDTVLKHGASEIDAVIVKLDHGIDLNGQRHVVRKIGNGRAWWE